MFPLSLSLSLSLYLSLSHTHTPISLLSVPLSFSTPIDVSVLSLSASGYTCVPRVLCLSRRTIGTLPVDVALSIEWGEAYESSESFKQLEFVWNAVFWLTLASAWVLIPTLSAMGTSGESNALRALLRAVRTQIVVWFAIVAGVGLVLSLLWLLGTFEWSSLTSLFIAFMNTYGLLLIVVLLGHGSVALPRALYKRSRRRHEVAALYFSAVHLSELLFHAKYELKAACRAALAVEHRSTVPSSLRQEADELSSRGRVLLSLVGAGDGAELERNGRCSSDVYRKGGGGGGRGAGGGGGGGGGVEVSEALRKELALVDGIRLSVPVAGGGGGGADLTFLTREAGAELRAELRRSARVWLVTERRFFLLLRRCSELEALIDDELALASAPSGEYWEILDCISREWDGVRDTQRRGQERRRRRRPRGRQSALSMPLMQGDDDEDDDDDDDEDDDDEDDGTGGASDNYIQSSRGIWWRRLRTWLVVRGEPLLFHLLFLLTSTLSCVLLWDELVQILPLRSIFVSLPPGSSLSILTNALRLVQWMAGGGGGGGGEGRMGPSLNASASGNASTATTIRDRSEGNGALSALLIALVLQVRPSSYSTVHVQYRVQSSISYLPYPSP